MIRSSIRRLFRLAIRRDDLRARDVEDEIALHVELRAAQLMREGLPPDEALAEARRRFASTARAYASVRRAAFRAERIMRTRDWIDSLGQDLRFAVRALARRPGFTSVAALTLALGIGVTTAVFGVVYAALLRPLPYAESDRLVQLWETSERTPGDRNPVSVLNYQDWLAESRSYDAMLSYAFNRFTLSGDGVPEQIQAAQIRGDLAGMLGVRPILGRAIRADDERAEVAVLGEPIWRRRFGADPSIVGRTIRLNAKPHTIVGVMPASFVFPRRDVELWTAYANILSDPVWSEQRGRRFQRVVARLRRDVSPAQAAAELDGIARGLATRYPEANEGGGATLVPLREQLVGESRRPLLLLLGAVACVLLIACANVAHLLLARTAGRERELAVRAALGAGRGRIARTLMTESLVLAAVGGAGGVLLAFLLVGALGRVDAEWLESAGEVRVDGWVLAFSVAIVAIAGTLAGLAPALRAASAGVAPPIQSGSRTAGAGRRGQATQAMLVTVQVATALLLLVGAGLLVRSYERLSGVDPGMEPSGVLAGLLIASPARYPEPERQRQLFDAIVERAASLPGVRSVGLCDCLPPDQVRQSGSVVIEGEPEGAEPPIVEQTRADAGYFSALRIPVLAGRAFVPADRDGAPAVAIVNATFARRHLAAGRSLDAALGRRLSLDGERWMTVVGVVGDVRYAGLAAPPAPAMYYAFAQQPFPGMFLFVRTDGDPLAQLPSVQRAVLAIDAELPLARAASLEDGVAASVAGQRLNTRLLGGFAALAGLLAALGVYGVVAHAVAQREREMGVRMALGARPGDVVRLAVGRGLRPVGMGIVVGVVLATVATRLLASALYETSRLDPATYGAAALGFGAVAALAAWIPSRRAARADPVAVLRGE